MGHIGLPEILVVGLIIVLLFGARKLPDLGAALGKAIKEFKKSSKDSKDETKSL